VSRRCCHCLHRHVIPLYIPYLITLHSTDLPSFLFSLFLKISREDHRERDSLRRESHDRDHPHRSGSGSTSRHGISYNHNHNPVVFAFPGREAGSKVVDYYMTWRGKTVCSPQLPVIGS